MGDRVRLFVFGLGYTAGHFVRDHRRSFDGIAGTVRSAEKAAECARDGVTALRFDGAEADPDVLPRLAETDALLVSVQPGEFDPVLKTFGERIAASPAIRAIVYLSTIGVYGDHGGAWIDETASPEPTNPRQAARIAAEREWLDLGASTGKTVTVLRLAGIYGPSRNALDDLRNGEARCIDKPGQVFNRIHVADIGHAVAQALRHAGPQRIFNVTDDEPAPAPAVVAYAAGLMGRDPPPLIPFAEAALSPMARSFYGANRRVRNVALRTELGVDLDYPNYRAGLDALWAAGEGRS